MKIKIKSLEEIRELSPHLCLRLTTPDKIKLCGKWLDVDQFIINFKSCDYTRYLAGSCNWPPEWIDEYKVLE